MIGSVFVACVIAVHFWSIFNVLREVPAWILRMSIWEMLGVVAYTQVFALFESLILTVTILIMAFILPGKLFRDDLAVSSMIIVLLMSLWLVILHYNSDWIEDRDVRYLAIWGATLFAALGFSLWASRKWRPVAASMEQVVSRFTVLAIVFIAIDLFGLAVVIWRSINF